MIISEKTLNCLFLDQPCPAVWSYFYMSDLQRGHEPLSITLRIYGVWSNKLSDL